MLTVVKINGFTVGSNTFYAKRETLETERSAGSFM
jgi:hypothetical protein